MARPLSFVPALALAALAPLGFAHAATPANASADENSALQQAVHARLDGDRTGACWAAALIDAARVQRAFVCADPAQSTRIGADTAFEIGSISKTMTAALLAELIGAGKASLDDPLAAYLPAGTVLPSFEGQPILLRHLVAHTSGLPALPPGIALDPLDPYARLEPKQLLDALARVKLSHAPGREFAYSNYASMLLSYAVARRAGQDYETLIHERLFEPLGMRHAYIARKPQGVRAASGHLPNHEVVPAWNFGPDLAGVGGVRATLDDMVRYLQAHLGQIESPIAPALTMTQQRLPGATPIAMNWMLLEHGGRSLHQHAGGTGGFSAFAAFDRGRSRGVVLLSDTALTSTGGLADFGLHLLDSEFPTVKPRKAVPAAPALLDALAGDYDMGGMRVTLTRRDTALAIQAAGQPELRMGYDDHGDFYPLQLDALLTPVRGADGRYGFVWQQGGGSIQARPVSAPAASKPALPRLSAQALRAFAGEYPLTPAFVLSISERDGELYAQATGQGALHLVAVAADVFAGDAVTLEIHFERGADGVITGLALHQNGRIIHAVRR